jgi:type VI secretion system protein ImpA
MRDRLRDDSPGLAHIRKQLEAMEKTVREFGGEPAPFQMKIESKRPAGRGTDSDKPPVPARADAKAMVEERSMEEPSQPNSGAIRSREEAYRRLAEAADYLLRTEPHSPTPYLVMRAVAWGNMPLSGLLQELVQSEGDLRQLYKLLGMNVGE